jgi:hypothetical protein
MNLFIHLKCFFPFINKHFETAQKVLPIAWFLYCYYTSFALFYLVTPSSILPQSNFVFGVSNSSRGDFSRVTFHFCSDLHQQWVTDTMWSGSSLWPHSYEMNNKCWLDTGLDNMTTWPKQSSSGNHFQSLQDSSPFLLPEFSPGQLQGISVIKRVWAILVWERIL